MKFAPGTRLGSYEIVAPLGSGGMGEVYRGRDTRLGRQVAIKVLGQQLAGDPKARLRFEREAKAVAALSHPNILALFDYGESDGITFAVLELLEGETLRDRLSAGPLPLRKAVDSAVQIARGLAAAHEHGIVHRDLKPENIFLTRDGQVKILDFGLVRLAPQHSEAGTRDDPASSWNTDPGLAVGTAGYMAPEQARGLLADHRSDLFSLGAILYEMLAGHRAFFGETPSDRMVATLQEEPPELPASVPRSLDRIVHHCLEKQAGERFQSARDLVFDLEALSDLTQEPRGAPRLARSSRARWSSPLWLAGLLLITAAAGAGLARWLWRDPFPSPPVFRQLTFRRGSIHTARFAPDGETIVYGAAWEGGPLQVFTMRADRPESSTVDVPASADVLAVSRSGDIALSLGRRFLTSTYASLGTLARAPLAGGAPREILQGVHQADWAPDGLSLAVVRMNAIGGEKRLEYPIGKVLYKSIANIMDPRVSPTGDHVAVLEASLPDFQLLVFNLDGRREMSLPLHGFPVGLAWHPAGKEIWFNLVTRNGGALYAVPLNGEPRLVFRTMGWTQLFDISPNGKVLLGHHFLRYGIAGRAPGEDHERDLSWLGVSIARDLSVDGRTLLFTEDGEGAGSGRGTYLRRTDGSPPIQLGPLLGRLLSPDGKWIILSRVDRSLILLPTGAGESRALPTTPLKEPRPLAWFPDGRHILLSGSEAGGIRRFYVQDLVGGLPRAVTPPDVASIGETFSANPLSPDGRRVVAHTSDDKLWLVPLAEGTPRTVSNFQSGDAFIRWHAEGRSLFVWRRDAGAPAQVFRLDLATGTKEPWLEIRPPDPVGIYSFASLLLTPDGKSYAYTYGQLLSQLYLVEGLR